MCTCPPGTTGDPYTSCAPSKLLENYFSNLVFCKLLISIRKLLLNLSFCKLIIVFSCLVKIGECDNDSECPDNRACNQHQCVNPCESGLPCGKSAQCTPIGHRAVCKCPTGWGGDPSTECFQCKSC